MLGAVDWAAAGALVGEALGVAAAVVRLLILIARLEQAVRSNEKAVTEHQGRLDQNARHLDSNITAAWMLTMRVATMEDHLTRTDDYHPPVIVPRSSPSPPADQV